MGFNYGSKKGAVELSGRQICANWRDVDGDAFANGMLDGINKDRFRINLILKK